MKKWLIVGVIVLMLIVVLIIIFYPKNEVPKEVRCSTNEDCVLVEVCCSCEEGGTRGAIAESHKDEILEQILVNCQSPNSLLCNGTPLGAPNCESDVYAKCWDGWCSTSNQDPRL